MSATVRVAVPQTVYRMERGRHQIVEASAGTGKTFLLEHRVVDLVLRHGVDIEQILVVTFTEKATAELRSRIRGKLHQLLAQGTSDADVSSPHWEIDEEARARLRSALEGFDRATVSTIHAFCHRVLSDGAFTAGRLLQQEQVAAEGAFASAFDACLREEFAVDPELLPYLRVWLEGGTGRVKALRSFLFDVHCRGGELAPILDEPALVSALESAERALGGDLETRLSAISHASTRGAVHRRLLALRGALERWRQGGVPAALAALATVDFSYFRERELPEPCQALAAAVRDVDDASVSLEAAIATLFYPRVHERGQLEKRRRGHFDFDDMLTLLWEALAGDRGDRLAASLRRRFPVALIDEFQDTDPVQWKIFRRIYLDAPDGAELTLVGDPKQAIYSFRGADLHTYLEARDEILRRGGQLTTLRTNYRSTPEMVGACNRIFTGEPPYFSDGVEYRDPVDAGARLRAVDAGGAPVPAICVWRLGDGDRKISADQRRQQLSSAIVGEIETLLGDPQRALRVGPAGAEKPLRPGDIFILTRATSEAVELAEALRQRGIPSSLFKQEGLLQSREAEEVRDLLVAIARPQSAAARLRAWQTRFFGLTLAELENTRELEDTHPLIARLHDWHEIAQRKDVHRLFSAIMRDSRIVERELVLARDRRALTNFRHLFELLSEEASSSRCDLHELAERLQYWMDTITGIDSAGRNIQRPESDDQAVQVMTIHKSKGLENKVVFVVGGLSSGGGGSVKTLHHRGRRLAWIGRMTPEIEQQLQRESRGEDERLFYVALTRAVARMYLVHSEATRLRGPYATVNERLTAELAEDENFEFRPLPETAVTAYQPTEPGALEIEFDLDVSGGREELEALLRARRGPGTTSYSQLSGHHPAVPVADSDPGEAATEPDDLPGGRHLGIALHEVLERIPLAPAITEAFADWHVLPAIRDEFDRSLSRLGLTIEQRARAESAIYESLRAPLALEKSTMDGVATAAQEIRELEFLFSSGPGDAALVKGFIDLVFEFDGSYYVLDWKSDRLDSYDPQHLRSHVESHYSIQASLYAQALRLHLSGHDDCHFGGVVYMFLRGAASHFIPASDPLLAFDVANLRGWEA